MVSQADDARPLSSNGRRSPPITKFPDFAQQLNPPVEKDLPSASDESRGPSPQPLPNGLPAGLHSSRRWPARKHGGGAKAWTNNAPATKDGRHHQKSITEAIRNVRTRGMSITESTHEIAESLKAPVSYKLVILCIVWFTASILSNASSKAILTVLPKPVSITLVQFGLVSFWCLFLSWLAKRSPTLRNAMPVLKNGIRKPTKDIFMTTLPLTGFQIGGHILNSDAMARIPIPLVHTIKGLAPLMTVFAYRTFLNTQYSRSTYLSLIPLTLGVIMACSASFKANLPGLLYAVGSTVFFVTQNIFSKGIFNDTAKEEADGTPITRRKPDKLNLLCYSSAVAFVFTFPIWVWSDALPMISEYLDEGAIELKIRPGSLDHGAALCLEFIFNGTFHFAQSLLAFILLGMVSPVTYSVASLIKRVVVVIFAIVWWAKPMNRTQVIGFVLTFLGLYLYDRTADADKVERHKRSRSAAVNPLLPLNTTNAKKKDAPLFTQSPMNSVLSPVTEGEVKRPFSGGGGYTNGAPVGSGPGRPHGADSPMPLTNGEPAGLIAGTTQSDALGQQPVTVR